MAAERWERIYQSRSGRWDLTIEFGWENYPGYGQAVPRACGGRPRRITKGRVIFRNQRATHPGDEFRGWYMDPTPRDNEEFGRYTCYGAQVHGGWLNFGRLFTEPKGDARDRIDLLTIATHEIGHLLGLESRYPGYMEQVQQNQFFIVTAPRPLAGLKISLASFGTADHLGDFFGMEKDVALMIPNPTEGVRQLITGYDALAVAQASSFPRVDVRQNCPAP